MEKQMPGLPGDKPFTGAHGSPARYVVGHISELEKIPADRLDACLRELKDYVETIRSTRELVTTLAKLTGKSSAMKVGDFTWIDDGKNEKTVNVSVLENADISRPASK